MLMTPIGIVLSWNMQLTSEYEEIASYQLYAYQEGSAQPSTTLWKKVGDVKALPLPMACTLTQVNCMSYCIRDGSFTKKECNIFEVLMAASVKITAFWEMKPSSLVDIY
jgi:hypothetical protein